MIEELTMNSGISRAPLSIVSVLLLVSACNGRRASDEPIGGCRYAEQTGTCRLRDVATGPANSDDPNQVAVKLTYAWTGEIPPALRGLDPIRIVEWTVPRTMTEVALERAHAHAELPCVIAIDQAGPCPPDGPRVDPGAIPPPSTSLEDRRRAACPGIAAPQAPLHPELAGTGTAALAAALPLRTADGWQRTRADQAPAGTAGRHADSAGATYALGPAQIRVGIDDMIRVCAGVPGTGAEMIELEEAQDPGIRRRRLTVAGSPGVVLEWSAPRAGRRLVVWIEDRCRASLEPVAGDVPAEALTQLAEQLALQPIAARCRAR